MKGLVQKTHSYEQHFYILDMLSLAFLRAKTSKQLHNLLII